MQNSNLYNRIEPSVSAVKLAPVAMHTAVEHHGGAWVGVGGRLRWRGDPGPGRGQTGHALSRPGWIC